MIINKVQRRPRPRDINQIKFYSGTAWRQKRKQILERDKYQCQPCKRNNKINPGNIIDHIIPIEQGGARLDDNNLETNCKRCHAIKSTKERKNIEVGGSQNV